MNIPWEVIATVVLSALGGALIPAIGLWLQSRQRKHELTIKHEEIHYQRRLELALKVSETCYEYMAVSHRLKNKKDTLRKKALQQEKLTLGRRIQAHESQVGLIFPSQSVSAFRKFWRVVDEIRTSPNIHWTSVGLRLDEAYDELTKLMRADLGIVPVENILFQSFRQE